MSGKNKRKAHQEQEYDGSQSSYSPHFAGQPPQQTQIVSASVSKKQKTTVEPEVTGKQKMDAFNISIQNYIRAQIKKRLPDTSKVNEFENECLNCKKLPPYISKNAALSLGITPTKMYTYISGLDTLPANLFSEQAKSCFKDIKNELEEERQQESSISKQLSKMTTGSPMSTTESLSSMSTTESVTEGTTTTTDVAIDTPPTIATEEKYATCTTSFNSIIRRDLQDSVKTAFIATVTNTLQDVSDLSTDFAVLVLALMVSLRSVEFVQDSQTSPVHFRPVDGFEIKQILPKGFEIQSDMQFSIPPLKKELYNSTSFTSQFEKTFTMDHLNYIETAFTTKQTIRESTSRKYQLQESLNSLIPESFRDKMQSLQDVPPPVRKCALAQFKTNFDNLWKSNDLMYRAVNKVIDVLLKLHLAPERQKEYQIYVASLKKSNDEKERKTTDEVPFGDLSRDRQRLILRAEHRKLKKYEEKTKSETDSEKWKIRQKKADDRIKAFYIQINNRKKGKNVEREPPSQAVDVDIDPLLVSEIEETIAPEEVIEEEDMSYSSTNDTSRRRLNQLKGIIKSLIWKSKGQNITPEDVSKLSPEASEKEIDVCRIIINNITPYLPPEKKRFITAYQIPLVLLANDILRAAGYEGSTLTICPMPKLSKLQGLRLDSVSIYSMFSGRNNTYKKPRNFFVGGIWNKEESLQQDNALTRMLNDLYIPSNVEVVVASTAHPAASVHETLKNKVKIAARSTDTIVGRSGESSSQTPMTDAIDWVILDQSEHPVSESDSSLGDKAARALANGASVIICIGESLQEREAGNINESISHRMETFSGKITDWANIVVAYTPAKVANADTVVTPEEAQNIHAHIRSWLADNITQRDAGKTRIIYGGSVHPGNCKKLARQPDIDGFLVTNDKLTLDFEIYVNATQNMTLYDFNEKPIISESSARSLKDSIFNSFFSISALMKVCKKNGLHFAHNVTILPGCKYVRILGTKKGPALEQTSSSQTTDQPWDLIKEQQKKSDTILSNEILEIQGRIDQLTKDLKIQSDELKKEDFPNMIKKSKSDRTYSAVIQKIKQTRFDKMKQIDITKAKLKQERFEQHIRKKAIATRGKSLPGNKTKREVMLEPGVNIVKDMKLTKRPDDITKSITFSGTDNGLVKLTETVPFDYKRFQYHIKLHNRFSCLSEVGEEPRIEAEEAITHNYEAIPPSFSVTPGDMDFGTGNFREREQLNRDKNSAQGKKVQQIETNLSKFSWKQGQNPQQLERIYDVHTEYKNDLRTFYYSKKRVLATQKKELTARKFKDRLCAKERTQMIPTDMKQKGVKKTLMMFIGDRGFGYGSNIKGHKRFGGKWKQELLGKNTTVLITNENYTSQTCVFCYSKLSHPKKAVTKKDKVVYNDVNGAFVCYNPQCPSVCANKSVQTRDKVSALAIGLSGLYTLLIGQPLPEFCTASQYYTGSIESNTTLLLSDSEAVLRAESSAL